jgi:hypothetical protein
MYACKDRNPKVLYVQLHQSIRYQVLNLYECISYYGLNLKPVKFMQYKIELINV